MSRHWLVVRLCAFVLLLATVTARTQAGAPVEEIRKELLRLTYYGAFDFLAFSYDKGTVTLMGYAYSPNLKKSAERAAKRAPQVDQVINKIEELPASLHDDELRWNAFYKIYGDPSLSRYAPGGGMLWGRLHRSTVRLRRWGRALHGLRSRRRLSDPYRREGRTNHAARRGR